MLRPVPNIQPWHRLEAEPPSAYDEFVAWLMSEPRPAPPESSAVREFGWAERAKAHDDAVQMPSGTDLAESTVAAMLNTAYLEAKKLEARARGATPSVTPKELVMLMAYIQKCESELRSLLTADEDIDLSNLPDPILDGVREYVG